MLGGEPSLPDTTAHNCLQLRIVINLDNCLLPQSVCQKKLTNIPSQCHQGEHGQVTSEGVLPVHFPKLILEVLEGEFGNWLTFNR